VDAFFMDWGDIWPCVDAIFEYRRINAENIHIRPGKNISVFLKERFVICDFLRGV
jgi:hypothetical protein